MEQSLSGFVFVSSGDGADPCPTGRQHNGWGRRKRRWLLRDAISGLDLALWDLAGNPAGLPVAAMLNPRRNVGLIPA
ncbi:MAG: hypothetical protein JJE04_18045 [Acidobacteriia bacterium]|nr:hypothetical protein [Terriglobia bacterium]